jgi:hypothetical protein
MNSIDVDDSLDMPLDHGIRRYVMVLRKEGVETFESCEGGQGHAFTEPTVRFHGNAAEGYRAFTAAMNYGLLVFSLRRSYQVIDGWLEGPWWERHSVPRTPNLRVSHNACTWGDCRFH